MKPFAIIFSATMALTACGPTDADQQQECAQLSDSATWTVAFALDEETQFPGWGELFSPCGETCPALADRAIRLPAANPATSKAYYQVEPADFPSPTSSFCVFEYSEGSDAEFGRGARSLHDAALFCRTVERAGGSSNQRDNIGCYLMWEPTGAPAAQVCACNYATNWTRHE